MSGRGKSSSNPNGGKPRQHPGIKGRRPDLRSFRQTEAKERLEVWQGLSVEERIRILDARLGKGIGATKQRARLQMQLENKA